MNVLHLLSSTGFHGAENMAAELIKQLSIIGIKNYLGVLKSNNNSNLDILQKIKEYIVDGVILNCHGKFDLKIIPCIHQYIKKNEIEIIHSHKYKTNFYSLFSRFNTNCRLVSTCHNWLGDSLNMRIYALIDKYILKGFDQVVGVSDDVFNEISKYVSDRKIHKIGNGVDLSKYVRINDKDDAKMQLGIKDKKLIGFIGRLSEEKGVIFLLRAVKQLIEEKHNIFVMIVGDGDHKEELIAEAKRMRIESHINFTGARSDTPLIYSALDVFVLPSLREAFPMVILEAMACGTPVVATKVGDIPQIITDKVSGLIINVKDVEDLKNALNFMISNPDKAEYMATRALNDVKTKFSSFSMAQKYDAVYKMALQ